MKLDICFMKKLPPLIILLIIVISCSSKKSVNDYLEDDFPDEIIREQGIRTAQFYYSADSVPEYLMATVKFDSLGRTIENSDSVSGLKRSTITEKQITLDYSILKVFSYSADSRKVEIKEYYNGDYSGRQQYFQD